MVRKRVRKKAKRRKKPSETIAIVALILNVLILPGLGTIIAGKTDPGVIQLILFLVGIPLIIVLVGIPIMIAAWVWALITSIRIIKEATA